MDDDLTQLADAKARMDAALSAARAEQAALAARRGREASTSGDQAETIARLKAAHAKLLEQLGLL